MQYAISGENNNVRKDEKRIDVIAMARGYEEMAEINLEEANAGYATYDDGMGFYKE